MIRQNAVQNNMRNVCGHRGNEGTITARAASTLQGVDVSCKTIGDAAGMSHGGNECPPNRWFPTPGRGALTPLSKRAIVCTKNPVELLRYTLTSAEGFSGHAGGRSCTCCVRINTPGSPVDRHRGKKA